MKHITVIMSVFNEPLDWISGSIESILRQTFKDFEFIIINDNPNRKDISNLVSAYKSKDARILFIENEKNLGQAEARNRGLKIASGKYIAIMDADDISLPERLQRQYQFLENHNDIFLLGCSAQIMDRNGQLREKAVKTGNHNDIVKNLLTGRLAFYHPTIMFRNEGLLYRGKFTCEDYDFYLTLLSQGKKNSNIKEICLNYRVSGQNISMTRKRKQVIHGKLALKFYYERQQTGYDSYDKLDFGNEEQIIKFIGIPADKLEALVSREQLVFALGAGDYRAARQTFECYKKYGTKKTEKLVLWLFLNVPYFYKIYRKLRYEFFRI